MRRVDTRFVTAVESSSFEALNTVIAHYGPRRFLVLNLSEGGAALSFADGEDPPKEFKSGAQVDVSMEIQKMTFPITLSIRDVVGTRMHCQFLAKSPAFEIALKEFFVAKALGSSLSRNESLSDHHEVQALVADSEWHEVWVAPNQTGLFVWFGEDDVALKILLVSKDIAWEWGRGLGAKSGHRSLIAKSDSPQQAFEIIWDREMSPSTKTFVAEILSAWLGMGDDARKWVARLVESHPADDALTQIGCAPLLRRLRKA